MTIVQQFLPESDESVVEQLDNMLAKAKIEPELIESLGCRNEKFK